MPATAKPRRRSFPGFTAVLCDRIRCGCCGGSCCGGAAKSPAVAVLRFHGQAGDTRTPCPRDRALGRRKPILPPLRHSLATRTTSY
jgi:hypothetical protein